MEEKKEAPAGQRYLCPVCGKEMRKEKYLPYDGEIRDVYVCKEHGIQSPDEIKLIVRTKEQETDASIGVGIIGIRKKNG